GNTNFGSSTSSVESHLVKANSLATMASSPNPSVFGQAVTLAATVTAVAPASGTPTGTVSFDQGGTNFGTASLNGAGQASIIISTLSVGSHGIKATYSGDSTFNGNISGPVTQVVNQATPTITWANPADITYGTALGGTQLNATASVAGSFVYTPAAGVVLNVGAGQTLHADFTPTDTGNYNTASKDATINVLKATPIITWNNPADITSGTAQGSTQ